MKYISGIHALNIPCSLNTMGDWHASTLQWDNPCMYDTEESIFKDFGIEYDKKIPEHTETYAVANHIRAFLDLMDHGQFGYAQGTNRDFIANKDDNKMIFSKVLLLRNNKNWEDIKDFMNKEFKMDWVKFLKDDIKFHNNLDTSWYEEHKRMMDAFLNYLYKNSDLFVLRDSTALQYCYDLTRFSDEIMLAGPTSASKELHSIVNRFCIENNISFMTDIYKSKEAQFHIFYNNQSHPLKVELNQCNNAEEIISFDQYKAYTINDIFMQKEKQFTYHNRIRDLYDIVYICNHYWEKLNQRLINYLKDSFFYLEYDFFEMIFVTQVDELIDTKQFKKDFKKVWEKIGF